MMNETQEQRMERAEEEFKASRARKPIGLSGFLSTAAFVLGIAALGFSWYGINKTKEEIASEKPEMVREAHEQRDRVPHEEYRSRAFGYDVRVADMRDFFGSTRVVEMNEGHFDGLPYKVVATDDGIDGTWREIYIQREKGSGSGRLEFWNNGSCTWVPTGTAPFPSGDEILRIKSLLRETVNETVTDSNRQRNAYGHNNNWKEVEQK